MARSQKQGDSMMFGMQHTITDEQYHMLDLIAEPCDETNIIIVEAGAGMGKTLMATMGAKLRGTDMRYIFAPVQEGKQGFLPGDLADKSAYYLAPLKDALMKINEFPGKALIPMTADDMVIQTRKQFGGWVFAHPHTFERGVNYENETVIIDEAQNFTAHELRKVLTRPHDNCKIIVMGNLVQCDLENPEDSGFEQYIHDSIGIPWIKKVTLTKDFRGRVSRWADSVGRKPVR